MKKWISLFLSVLCIAQLVIPAFAEKEPFGRVNDRIPTIMVAGDGNALFMPDETAEGGEREVYSTGGLREKLTSIDMLGEDSSIETTVANVLQPYFKEGILEDNWDPYYKALEKEIGNLFTEVRLDKDGNAQFGTNVSGWCQWSNWYSQNNDNKGDKGYYGLNDYCFWYDWRLDPMETAKTLHEFIQNVKRVTNSDKVALFAACLGSNVALAYIAQYGTEDLYSVALNASVSNGAEYVSESISGKARLDGYAIMRFLDCCGVTGMFNVDDFVRASIELATRSGLLDGWWKFTKATVYDKIAQGVTSALALSSFFTMPCYWSCICPENYDDAMRYVFGEEGSEKRQEYAGLIEKIENYHNTVSLHVPELMQSISDNGVLLSILAKYGMQMIPLNESNELVSDEFTSLKRASFGATTSTIFDTLSDDYIAQRIAEGKGKYISPDKQVDASTCMFPDNTWFVKGATHVTRTDVENEIQYTCLTADRQLSVDDFDWTQFLVFDNETGVMAPMTAENCHTEAFSTDKENTQPKSLFARLKLFFKALKQWLRLLSNILEEKRAAKTAE